MEKDIECPSIMCDEEEIYKANIKYNNLVNEIIKTNKILHIVDIKFREIGLTYPNLIFYDDFDENSYLSEKEVIN